MALPLPGLGNEEKKEEKSELKPPFQAEKKEKEESMLGRVLGWGLGWFGGRFVQEKEDLAGAKKTQIQTGRRGIPPLGQALSPPALH